MANKDDIKVKRDRKRKKKASASDSGWKRVATFSLGVFFILLTLFTMCSIVSYLFTWMEDQSLLDSDIINNIIIAQNKGGKIGFFWSNFLVGKLFGFGAFVIPFFFGALGVLLLRIKKLNFFKLFFLSLMGCIVLSMLFSFVFSFSNSSTLFGQGAGGSYGYYINEWLTAMLGKFGAGAIIAFLFILWIVLLNNKVIDYFNRYLDRFKKPKTVTIDGNGFELETDLNFDKDRDSDGDDDMSDDKEDGANQESGADKKNSANQEEDPDGKEVRVGNIEEEDVDEGAGVEIVLDELEDTDVNISDGADGQQDTANGVVVPKIEIIEDKNTIPNELLDEKWREMYDPRLSLPHYSMPPLTLMENTTNQQIEVSQEELDRNSKNIVTALSNYRIGVAKISVRRGPTVTLYEVVPAPGVRVSTIKRLEDDIARSLAAIGVRVVTLIGSNAVGIEVANEKPKIVSMRSVLEDPKFKNSKFDLPIVIGKTILNETMTFDLAKMPHILIAGATGQGKSVGLNAIITSLLYKKHPAELKLVLVDPKKVELSLYSPLLNHFLAKLPDEDEAILTDTQKVIYTLRSLCKLMDTRYDLLKAASVRNIKEYNEKFLSRKLNPQKGHDYMPYIVVIIDEFADLLVTAGREIEEPITRLAQLARAIGIHLVIATQRPTTNIITGTIKANFPARIAFKVFSSVDSKTILDQTGANHLIGRGDMLVLTGSSEPTRVQCAFIDTPEVEKITNYIHSQQGFGLPYLLPEVSTDEGKGGLGRANSGERDELFEEAARLIVREQQGSTSLIQRKMLLGYNRAGRIMDQLEAAGIVGPSEGSKARQVKIGSLDSLEQLLSTL